MEPQERAKVFQMLTSVDHEMIKLGGVLLMELCHSADEAWQIKQECKDIILKPGLNSVVLGSQMTRYGCLVGAIEPVISKLKSVKY